MMAASTTVEGARKGALAELEDVESQLADLRIEIESAEAGDLKFPGFDTHELMDAIEVLREALDDPEDDDE